MLASALDGIDSVMQREWRKPKDRASAKLSHSSMVMCSDCQRHFATFTRTMVLKVERMARSSRAAGPQPRRIAFAAPVLRLTAVDESIGLGSAARDGSAPPQAAPHRGQGQRAPPFGRPLVKARGIPGAVGCFRLPCPD